jgi:hypothetical protein
MRGRASRVDQVPSRRFIRVEELERRECPSCTIVQTGDTLSILGDREANRITIADTREGDIAVSCDGGDPHRFAGVSRITVSTFGGDDSVAATFGALRASDFQFRADLGAGDDRLAIRGFDPQPDPPAQSLAFAIDAGLGNDSVAFDLGSAEINGRFAIDIDGGLGVDGMSIRAIIPCILPESELRIGLVGGPGNDAIETSFTGLENEGGRFALSAAGGEDNDRLALNAMDPCLIPGSRTRIAVSGGADDDAISARLGGAPETESAELDGLLRLEFDGGRGDDSTALELFKAEIHGATQIDLEGNAGDDSTRLEIAADVRVLTSLDLVARGGIGNDVMESFIVPCIRPEGRGHFLFDGGEGNDRIDARIGMHEHDTGALAVLVRGGLGDDDLTLAMSGTEHLNFLQAVVDGEDGYDAAHATSDVRVANCEEIEILDGPR